jgi:hypothetical protein
VSIRRGCCLAGRWVTAAATLGSASNSPGNQPTPRILLLSFSSLPFSLPLRPLIIRTAERCIVSWSVGHLLACLLACSLATPLSWPHPGPILHPGPIYLCSPQQLFFIIRHIMSTLLTDTRSTATTHSTAHTTTHKSTTTSTSARPFLLHPQRPPSRNKILCEFAQSQGINSYGSWRFQDDSKHSSNNNPHKDSDLSQPGSPISSSSSSEREDRLRGNSNSITSPAYDPDVLRARASRGSSSLGSSWGVSSIGKSFDWTWKSDDTGGASDADTEPTDDEREVEAQRRRKQEPPLQPPLQPPPPLHQENGSENENENENESPKTARSFGFHSIGSPLTFPSTSTTTKRNIIELSSYNLQFSPLVPRTIMTVSAVSDQHALDNPGIHSPIPQSPLHSRSISPFVSPGISRAPSSAGSTTSSRFRRRSSQKRISLIAGRVSYTPHPSPPPVDTDADDYRADHHHHHSPRLLRLSSTSSFA